MIVSPRQTDVLELAAAGLCDKEIAAALGVGHRTVRTHLEILIARTGHRRTGLVAAWLLDGATEEQRGRVRARLAGRVA